MAVRARVWSTGPYPMTPSLRARLTIRGRLGKSGRTWHYAVYNSAGEVVLYDNTGNYETVLRLALVRVEALRHMETAGHRLKPYRGDR